MGCTITLSDKECVLIRVALRHRRDMLHALADMQPGARERYRIAASEYHALVARFCQEDTTQNE